MKIKDLPIKDCEGNELDIGDRVMFNVSICQGFGEMGTITKIERDMVYDETKAKLTEIPYGNEFQFVCWIKWDCHGHEIGEIFDLRECVKGWKFVERQLKLT